MAIKEAISGRYDMEGLLVMSDLSDTRRNSLKNREVLKEHRKKMPWESRGLWSSFETQLRASSGGTRAF